MRHLLLTLLALLAATSLRAETIRERMSFNPDFRIYVVMLSVRQNPDGSIKDVKLSKIIDPRTGSTDPIKLDLPEKFVPEAEKLIRARKYDVDKTSKDGLVLPFATYYFYAPSLGSSPITDLDAKIP